jgi:hypothetical protein
MRRTTSISCQRRRYLGSGVLRPLVAALPVVPLSLGLHFFGRNPVAAALCTLLNGTLLLFAIWHLGIADTERRVVRSSLGRLIRACRLKPLGLR